MEFQPGALSLSQISGGTLASGTVPFTRFQRDFQQHRNPGIVNLTAALTQVNFLTLTGMVVGDYVLAVARISGQKGATNGRCTHRITVLPDPGDIAWQQQATYIEEGVDDIIANGLWSAVLVGFGIVTTAGNCILEQRGTSIGSNFAVPGFGGALDAWVIPGS